MKVKALDTLHITSVQSDPIRPGTVFDLHDPDAKKLIDRHLVERVSSAKRPKKKAPAPRNKKAQDPANKAG